MPSDFEALWGLLRPYARRYALGGLLLLLCDLGQLVGPWLVGRIIDALRVHQLSPAQLEAYVAWLLGAALFVAAGRYGWRQFVFGTARMVERDLRTRLYAHLQTLPASFYGSRKVGDLMAHATNDIQAIRAIAGEGVMSGIDPVFYIVSTVAVMGTTVDWRLTLVSLLPLPLMAVLNGVLTHHVRNRYKDVQASFADLSDRVQEAVSGVRVVKGFVQEGFEKARFAEVATAYRQRFMGMVRLESLSDPGIALLTGTSSAIALVVGGGMVRAGTLTLGQLVSFLGYLGMLSWPMLAISWAINLLARATASMSRLQALLDLEPEIADRPGALALPRPQGAIAIRDLSFGYSPDLPPVLSGIDLELGPGRILGIVGPTGSGKTTLVSLLARLFDPPPGTVFVDGTDVLDLKLADLRAAIGFVPQDAFLFGRTLESNVDFTPPQQGLAAVRAALDLAAMATEAEALPEGLATVMGERGVTLSGGQRQRVTMARALVRQPKVLVLDDCLSAVDAATEARILEGLASFAGLGATDGAAPSEGAERVSATARQRTTVLVAHRLSIVRHADLIVFLEQGRIVERGSHAELLAQDGRYASVWRQQQAEAQLAAEV